MKKLVAKIHIVAYPEKDKPRGTWSSPKDVTAMCGEELAGQKPVGEYVGGGHMSPRKTFFACAACLVLSAVTVDKTTWLYPVLPADMADRMNARGTEEN